MGHVCLGQRANCGEELFLVCLRFCRCSRGGCRSCRRSCRIDLLACLVERLVSGMLVDALLGLVEDRIRADLRLLVCPRLSNAVEHLAKRNIERLLVASLRDGQLAALGHAHDVGVQHPYRDSCFLEPLRAVLRETAAAGTVFLVVALDRKAASA